MPSVDTGRVATSPADSGRTPAVRGRRSLLASLGTGLVAALAGCLDSGGPEPAAGNDSAGTTDTPTANEGDPLATTARSGTDSIAAASGSSGSLDLREANVVSVTIERGGSEGRYTFDVTLHHDDDGESGYADWWQVETTAGNRLGRRELLHAHGSEPFTRSATIDIPRDVHRVVVRGHDETHGYG